MEYDFEVKIKTVCPSLYLWTSRPILVLYMSADAYYRLWWPDKFMDRNPECKQAMNLFYNATESLITKSVRSISSRKIKCCHLSPSFHILFPVACYRLMSALEIYSQRSSSFRLV